MHLKQLLAGVTALALGLSLAACGADSSSAAQESSRPAAEATAEPEATPEQTEETPETAGAALRIAGLKGPTTMGLCNLINDTKDSGEYEFTMYGSADEFVSELVKGNLDAAAVPANLAATLYQRTEGQVQVACINTLGVLYVVENGDTIQSVADLKGKTIWTTGKGTTPEYVLRYVLTQNGLDPDTDVDIQWASESTEALGHLQKGDASIAMLPQPFVTTALSQVEGLRVALDMNTEWEAVAGSKLVTGVLVARTDAIARDPAAFDAFLEAYAASVDAANTDVEGTAALCEEYGIVAKAALAQKAIPACNIVFETGDEMKADLVNYFQVLFDADPASVGGAMPDDAFYYGVADADAAA